VLHNTEVLRFPSRPEGRLPTSQRDVYRASVFLCRKASAAISRKLSLNNITLFLRSTL